MEGLAASGFWGFVGEILVLEEILDEFLVDGPAFAHGTVLVVFLGAIGEVTDYGID